jgi:hypothetical protein
MRAKEIIAESDNDELFGKSNRIKNNLNRSFTRNGNNYQRLGAFSGAWSVIDSSGRELYRFSGIGNVQADANRIAQHWAERNNYHNEIEVVPVLSPLKGLGMDVTPNNKKLIGWNSVDADQDPQYNNDTQEWEIYKRSSDQLLITFNAPDRQSAWDWAQEYMLRTNREAVADLYGVRPFLS